MNNYQYDFYRFYGRNCRSLKEKVMEPLTLKYMRIFRKCQSAKGIFYLLYRFQLEQMTRRTHIEMDPKMILGKGFIIMHLGGWLLVLPK